MSDGEAADRPNDNWSPPRHVMADRLPGQRPATDGGTWPPAPAQPGERTTVAYPILVSRVGSVPGPDPAPDADFLAEARAPRPRPYPEVSDPVLEFPTVPGVTLAATMSSAARPSHAAVPQPAAAEPGLFAAATRATTLAVPVVPAVTSAPNDDQLPSDERNMLIFVTALLALGTLAIVAMAGFR